MVRLTISALLLLFAAAINYGISTSEAEIFRSKLDTFPTRVGEWEMIDEQRIDDKSMEVLGVDDYVMRTYSDGDDGDIGLYIGYFGSQQEGKQIHSPRQCLLGSGWVTIRHEEYDAVLKRQHPANPSINLDLLQRGSDRILVLWWYQGRGRSYSSEYRNKAYLVWDRLTKRRTDGALVRVHSTVNGDTKKSMEDLTDFANLLMPYLPLYIPD
jgi:EpsI family protein